jgi:hypothetical protein
LPFILETSTQFPRLRASRLYDNGQGSRLSRPAGSLPAPDRSPSTAPQSEAFLRLRTLPGEQMQVDWGHFGHLEIGGHAGR